MATEVFTTETITLLNGEEVELRPLAIAKLRKFMRLWSDHIESMSTALAKDAEDETRITEAELTDKQFDVFIKMCAFGLETQLKEEKTEKQFIAYLEDTLDEQTIYKIIDVTGGLKLGPQADPNLLPAMMPVNPVGDGEN